MAFRLHIAPLFALLTLATAANAERPKLENLRYEEDWSVLRDETGPEHLLDPIKYIPFDEDGDFWLSLGGQARARLEVWNGFLFGSSRPDSDDVYLLGRVRLHADLHLTRYFRAFAEFKSAFLTDRTLAGGRRPVDEDLAALQNAFGELRLPGDAFDVGVMGGRRELQFGAQRLVSPLDWANVRRTFDGASAYASGEGWRVDGFWSRPVIVRQRDTNKSSNARQLYGIYATLALPASGLDLDLYWLGLHLDTARAANGTPGDANRHTLGGRVFGAVPGTPLRAELEGAAQVGSVGSQGIGAGMVSTVLRWPFAVPFEPSLHLGYDWASGDSGRGGSVGTFDQLYPLGHAYLGFIDVIARQNIHAIQGGARSSPLEGGVLEMTWHSFWLDDRNDALYGASGAPIRFDPTATSSHVGVEVDLTFKYAFARGLATLIGYSHFFTGRYISDSGRDKDVDFFYLQLQYTL